MCGERMSGLILGIKLVLLRHTDANFILLIMEALKVNYFVPQSFEYLSERSEIKFLDISKLN